MPQGISMKPNIDLQIQCLRKLCWQAKTDEEAWEYFERLNLLQQERKATVGSFLPCDKTGKVHAFNLFCDIWFSFPAEVA